MKKSFLLFLLGLLYIPLNAQFTEALETLTEYNQNFPREILYLHTDREVYSAGDTIWFKGYLRVKASLKEFTISESIFLNLINEKGNKVLDTKHLVFDSETNSQVVIPNDISPGIYQLVAYSSWMKNYDPSEVFRKTISIKEEYQSEPQFIVQLDQQHYYEGDNANAYIRFLDTEKKDILKRDLRCRSYHGSQETSDLKLESELQNVYKIPIPVNVEDSISIEISTVYQGYSYDTLLQIPVHYDINLEFFPEGGNCIQGITNKIAFKAENGQGKALDIEGGLYESGGGKIQDIKSDYLGMGSFTLLMEEGKEYYAQVTSPGGIDKIFTLPEVQRNGWSISAVQFKENLHLTLTKNDLKKELGLITLETRGQIESYIADTIYHEYRRVIPVKDLPLGICVITVYNEQLIPKSERLVFINYDKVLNPTISADYKSYLPRDKTKLEFSISDPDIDFDRGSYSLAVVDEELCMNRSIDAGNILTSFMLASEIKGYIENPAYYFRNKSAEKRNHLDLLLLTQGWRRYNIDLSEKKNLLGGDEFPTIRDIIKGQLITDNFARKQVPVKGEITIYNAGGTGIIPTDENGKFEFMHNYQRDINPNISLFGKDFNGKQSVQIKMKKDNYGDSIKRYFKDDLHNFKSQITVLPSLISEEESRFSAGINNRWIDEVVVYARRNEKEIRPDASLPTAQIPSQDAISNAMSLYDILLNMGYQSGRKRA